MSPPDLDPGTEALWLLARLVPDRGVGNIAVAVDLDRPARWWPLREAFHWLVRRHPALRTSFPEEDGRPVRRVLHPDPTEPDQLSCPTDDLDTELRRYAATPFTLDRPPLARVGMCSTGTGRHAVCLVAAQIVLDGRSVAALAEELGIAYRSFAADGMPPDLPDPLPPAAAVPPAEAALAYWRDRVAGYDAAAMRLGGARQAGAEPTFAGEDVRRRLGERATRALATLRRASRGTDASVLLACYHATLRRLGAAADQVVGVSVDGREDPREIGYRVTTMPLRVQIDEGSDFLAHAALVSRALRDGQDHAGVPYELLARQSGTAGDGPDWWRARLVRHLFNYRSAQSGTPPFGAGSAMRSLCIGLSRFDTELIVERDADGTVLTLEYSAESHDAVFAERFLAGLERILCAAGEDPAVRIGDVDLRTPEDTGVLARTNDTAVRWNGPPSVLGMVVQAARAAPDTVALVDGGGAYTYRQLLAAAATARDAVDGKGPVVAVAGPRGAGLAAAALGVWAAGAGYLPLDHDHPPRRLATLLDDAGCNVVLGGAHLPEQVRRGRLCLPLPDVGRSTEAPLPTVDEPDVLDLAYLIFTSGSTGRPKGVRLSHGNLANLVRHFGRELVAGPGTAAGWLTTFAFDISALELWLPLANGGRVVVFPDEVRGAGDILMDLVRRHDVSIVQGTPTTWRTVAPAAVGALRGRTLLCGGEPLTPALARDLRATGARVLNVYGPTETTIWSTVAAVDTDMDPVPVGLPIANTQVYVLDEQGRPQPVGQAGELAIGGAGVALGYHNRPDLTAERFVDAGPLGRLYRTGDRARLRPDGAIELLGRADRQVKLRAHRIELGEVERILEEHPGVRAAAVVLRGDPTGDGFLAAFVVAADLAGGDLTRDLWTHAAQVLPGYSVPARIVQLPQLPRNASGKVDLAALQRWPLPAPDAADGPTTVDAAPHEKRLVALWRELLGQPHLGPDANFFLSGGHSMLALRLATEATARCAVPVRLGMVFRAPTPAALAQLIQHGS